ncbi:hypothetical protein JTB14_031734 [Gonioctena quinquepunctata]|nr:hypothetical protein JTB14_031734 [Gonioctena quinquepunctata]
MRFSVIVILYLLELSSSVNAARILCVFHVPSMSHQRVFQPIWKELSLIGHNVTVVTPFPLNDPTLVNLTEIDISEASNKVFAGNGLDQLHKDQNINIKISKLYTLTDRLSEVALQHEQFIKIYNSSNAGFDLVIVQSFLSPLLYSLSGKFGAPLIGVSSLGDFINSHIAMGNPHPPSLYSEVFFAFNKQMTLFERVKSTLYYLWARFNLEFVVLPESDRIARKYLGSDLPHLEEIRKNISLLFVTSNPFLYTPRPTVPTVVNLEQIHVKPARPLPEDLQTFLDEATEGVVYFSLGSNVKSVNTPENFRNTLIEAFAELPYKVLWKYESDSLPKKPKNVHISKWLPQQDVLAHPNVKVFISQCGLQSVEESVSRGVPILGIPFIADQPMNIKRLTEMEVAIEIDYLTLTKEELIEKVKEIVENPKYRQNMENLRDLWSDHPMPPLERAMWWIEYVIRHKGTKHLRSPTVDVSWVQYLLIDVISVISVGLATLAFLLYVIVKCTIRFCSKKWKKD